MYFRWRRKAAAAIGTSFEWGQFGWMWRRWSTTTASDQREVAAASSEPASQASALDRVRYESEEDLPAGRLEAP